MGEAAYTFGDFVLDPAAGLLERDGTAVPIGQRGAALLAALLEAGGATVSKEQLLERAWPGLFVEEANLSVQVAALRKALGPREGDGEWIVTVPRVGYRMPRTTPTAAAPAMRPAIAVAPFENLSPEPEHAYFAAGVVEDIITALSRFRGFAVMAAGPAFAARERQGWAEAAAGLGVRYLLQGSISRRGGQLRLTVKLIDVESGAHLWAEQFDGAIEALFAFQDSIAENVVGLVEPQMQRAEIERARRKRPDSLGAYDLYLRALPHFRGTTAAARAEAVRLLDQAVAIDPGFAVGLAYCAWAHERHDTFGGGVTAAERAQALAMAERAAELGHDDAVVRAISALVLLNLGNEPMRSLAMLEEAREANPNHSTVLSLHAFANVMVGDVVRGRQGYIRALQISPEALDVYELLVGVGIADTMLGDFESALEWGRRGLAANSDWLGAHWTVISALGQLGRKEEGTAAVQRLLARAPDMRMAHMERLGSRFAHRFRLVIEGMRKAGLPE